MATSGRRRRAGLGGLVGLVAAGAGYAYALPRTGPGAAIVSGVAVGLFAIYLWWATSR